MRQIAGRGDDDVARSVYAAVVFLIMSRSKRLMVSFVPRIGLPRGWSFQKRL